MRNGVKQKSTRRKPKKSGRPKEFDQTITINVTKEWVRRINKAALLAGEDRSEFLRQAGEQRAAIWNDAMSGDQGAGKLPGWATEALALGIALPERLTDMELRNFQREVESARYELIQQCPQARNDFEAGRIWLALIRRDDILDYRNCRDKQIALRKKTSLGKSFVTESDEPIPPWGAEA